MDHVADLYAFYRGRLQDLLGTSPEQALQTIRPYLTLPIIGLALIGTGLFWLFVARVLPVRRPHAREELLKGRPVAHMTGIFLVLIGIVLAVPH